MQTPQPSRTYETPTVTPLGSFNELTLGGKTGSFLDKNFPAGTPFNQLTFS